MAVSAYGYGSTRPAAQGERGRENPMQRTPGGGDQGNLLRRQRDMRQAIVGDGPRAPRSSGGDGAAPTGIPASPVLPNGQMSPQQVVTGGTAPPPANPFTPPANWVPGRGGNYVPPNHPNAAPGGVAPPAPGTSGNMEGRVEAMINALLADPDVLGANHIAQMRGAAQNESTQMLGDLQTTIAQQAAGRGTLNSGTTAALQTGAHQQTIADMLNRFRDIEIQAAGENRDAEMAAIQAAQDFINGRFGRQIGRDQLSLQAELGRGGLAIDQSRLGESGRQFDLGHQLAWAGLLNNMVMGRLGYGLDVANMENGGNMNWLAQLMRGIGGGGS